MGCILCNEYDVLLVYDYWTSLVHDYQVGENLLSIYLGRNGGCKAFALVKGMVYVLLKMEEVLGGK